MHRQHRHSQQHVLARQCHTQSAATGVAAGAGPTSRPAIFVFNLVAVAATTGGDSSAAVDADGDNDAGADLSLSVFLSVSLSTPVSPSRPVGEVASWCVTCTKPSSLSELCLDPASRVSAAAPDVDEDVATSVSC